MCRRWGHVLQYQDLYPQIMESLERFTQSIFMVTMWKLSKLAFRSTMPPPDTLKPTILTSYACMRHATLPDGGMHHGKGGTYLTWSRKTQCARIHFWSLRGAMLWFVSKQITQVGTIKNINKLPHIISIFSNSFWLHCTIYPLRHSFLIEP